jgi:threonine 3-dehydrogenase
MQAVLKANRGKGIEIKEVPEPEIKRPDEVKIKINAASICGTDVHMHEFNEWAQNRLKPPFIIGHEVGGEVIEVGKDVTSIEVGDNVSMECHIACGVCYQCRSDRMHICANTKIIGVDMDGIFAEYAVIPELNAWKNDADLDPRLASLQDPLGNAIHTVLPKDGTNEDLAGKNIAVIGCGPIGLMSIPVAKALGASQIFATGGGRNIKRLELAKEMGADRVFNVREEGDIIVKEIMDATEGNGVDFAFEMSGIPSGLETAMDILTKGGRISLLGIFDKPFSVDVNRMVFQAMTIYGIAGRRMFQTWQQMRGLLRNKPFQEALTKVITHRFNMADVDKGFDEIYAKKAAKVVLDPFK